jgi:tRNA 5-methylaminomethyl-2-thiouridine biosynthesis bifunctional protein
MNTAPIAPARIVLDDDGTPRSVEHGDLYHPRSGALAQARHVFLADRALAARWRGRERFVVLETGFGLANNFLATWAAWRDDSERCRRLHFISIEQSPPTQATIASLARDAPLAPFAAELARRWPPLTCNLHRIAFNEGTVELLLAFGAIAAWLPQLVADVDAFFLDGFAPARNPAMWEPRVFKAMARLAAPGATVATWSAARSVRDGLSAAGFEVERAAGNEGKRDITRGRYAPRFSPRPWAPRQTHLFAAVGAPSRDRDCDVVVVGAGLAGCALADALARRGVRSLVLERNDVVAAGASGNAAGVFHGIVHRHDGRHARFHRAAALAAAAAVRDAIDRHGVRGSTAGLLRVEARLDVAAMRAIVAEQGLPSDYVEVLDAEDAGRLAGVRLSWPAWHYPSGGWVDPVALARAWLSSAAGTAQLRLGCAVASLCRRGDEWLVCDSAGATVAAARAVVLCDGSGGVDLLGAGAWPVRRQRGQISAIAAGALSPGAVPRLPIAGHGHVLPSIDDTVWFGTSTGWGDDAALGLAEQLHNLDRLAVLLGLPEAPRLDGPTGRVGFRWSSEDRLPIIGAVPAAVVAEVLADAPAARASRLDQPRFLARAKGLFVFAALGSRGIASASLGAEMLGAAIAGTPVPAEADLIDAVDPARFLSRGFRRGAARRLASPADQPPVGPIAGSFGG